MKEKQISAVRSFNRFYTNILGLLDHYAPNSKYSLPEMRVLYELYHSRDCTARQIVQTLLIDKSYLSRILLKLQRDKLVSSRPSDTDGRSALLSLTAKGRKAFEQIDKTAQVHIRNLLKPLAEKNRDKLVYHMSGIEQILSSL